MDFYVLAWKRYAQFSGRSTLGEYWWFVLFHFIVIMLLVIPPIVAAIVSSNKPNDTQSSVVVGISVAPFVLYMLASLIPSLAVTIRRMHDANLSGWLYLLSFLPMGNIAVLVFTLLPGTAGENKYGPNPLVSPAAAVTG